MKKILFINFIVAFTVCSTVAVVINHNADKSVAQIIQNRQQVVRVQVKDKIRALDSSLFLITDSIRKRAENAIATVEARLAEKEPDVNDLERWAVELGVSDLFLVNRSGVIFNTSNRREQGFNLKNSSSSVRDFIDGYLGKGIFRHDGLSVGMISGKTTAYSYYSPAGSDYIIEASLSLKDYITLTYGTGMYDYLFKSYFKDVLHSYGFAESIDLYARARPSALSILDTGRELPLNAEQLERLIGDKRLIIEAEGKYIEYGIIPYLNETTPIKAYIYEIVYDFSEAGAEIERIALLSVITVYVTGLIFLIFSALTLKNFSRRVVSSSELRTDGRQKQQSISGGAVQKLPRTGRILLVDDSPYNKFVIESYLAETGLELTYTDNGKDALRLFTENKYDLVLTDIQMPEMDGYKLAEEIRSLEQSTGMKHTPVIAITAFNLERDAQKCLEAGCDAHVAKPLNKEALLKTVYAYSGISESFNMETEMFHARGGIIKVEVKPEFKDVTPLFLSDLRQLKPKTAELLKNQDYYSIQLIGHRLKGEAKCFGFDPVSDYGLFLHGAAVRGSKEKIEEIISLIDDYASRVQLVNP